MYSREEIISKSWLVKEAINLVLASDGLSVERIFLIGSYAQGKATDYSDIDYLIQIKGGKRPLTYPSWRQMEEIKDKINNSRIHVIYGTYSAQHAKWLQDPVKFSYREITHASTCTSSLSQ